jgi:cytochrome b pre-mRNA-processing protein 3
VAQQSSIGSLITKMLQGPGEVAQLAAKLHAKIVAQARHPDFYRRLGVPDNVDGRFELIVLHAFVIFNKLKEHGEKSQNVSQVIYDVLIKDMEASLRQLGVGDLGVGKRVRIMTEAMRGRIAAYESALNGNQIDLEGAVRRNIFGTTDPSPECVRQLAFYLRQAKESADKQPIDRILKGIFDFPPVPVQGNSIDSGRDDYF